jgi:hypothetical protein
MKGELKVPSAKLASAVLPMKFRRVSCFILQKIPAVREH